MKATLTVALTLSLVVPALVLAADTKKSAPSAKDKEMLVLDPAELKWGEAGPDLPKGAQIVVLSGDPSKPAPFTLRFKMPDGYKIPPHWHTQDEHLTILSGTFVLHMGDTMDAPAHEMGPGWYHYLPGKMHHAAETKGETVLQLHGTGPFDIHYLNPADNPNKTAKAGK